VRPIQSGQRSPATRRAARVQCVDQERRLCLHGQPLTVDGKETARESFSLIEVPTCAGGKQLQVASTALDELASRFKPGCLAAMLPADFASALERRSAGAQ
jgi:hypothetical protein